MGEVEFIDPKVARIGIDRNGHIATLWLNELCIDATNIDEVQKAIGIYRKLISK